MTYNLVISQLAHQDLESILEYIAVQLGNRTAAGALLNEIEACYSHLKTTPMMFARCHDTRLQKEGYRNAVIKNYI